MDIQPAATNSQHHAVSICFHGVGIELDHRYANNWGSPVRLSGMPQALGPVFRWAYTIQTLLACMGEEGFIGNIADSQAKLRVLLPSLRPDDPAAQCRHWSAMEKPPGLKARYCR